MKVRLVIDVGDFERYVIAKYFSVAPEKRADRLRTRATRAQVRRFTGAALRTLAKEYAENLRGREKAAAKRLAAGGEKQVQETLAPPAEQQRTLTW